MSQTPRRVLAEGRHLRLVEQNGWEFAERTRSSGVVVIVAVDDGTVILTEQYRRPVGARVIDLPAGLAGDIEGQEDEPLETAARRELEEETGYRAQTMRLLTDGPTSAGLSSEIVTYFFAENVRRIGPGGGDDSEEIDVHEVPLESMQDWLHAQSARGCAIDSKVYVGLYFIGRQGG